MNKVLLPFDVAEAIEKTWELFSRSPEHFSKHLSLTDWHLVDRYTGRETYSILLQFARDFPMDYMSALVYGYEVAKDPEEMLIELFRDTINKASKSDINSAERPYYNGFWKGIKEATNILDPSIILDENGKL